MLDDDLKKFLEGVKGICEANSFERMKLWEENRERYGWKENLSGLLETIGTLDNRPVCLSFQTAIVKDRKILLWDACSQVVDHKQIDEWFAKNMPGIPKTDAMNFHNILRD